MTMYYVSKIGNDSTGDGSIGNPYATISRAITRAVNGDVIEVAAGTYETNFDVDKAVTINGVNAGKQGISSDRASEETVLQNTKSNILANATLDGLKFKHTANITEALILQSGPTIKNCVFERIAIAAGQPAKAITTSSSAGNYNITNNLFTGSINGGLFSGHLTWNSGLYLTNVSGKVGNIENNIFNICRTAINSDDNNSLVTLKNNGFSNCGTYVTFAGTTPPTAGMPIENNTFNISNLGSTLINNSNVADSFKLDISNNLFKFGDVSLTSGQLSLEQKFTIETRILHKGKSSRKGIVYFSNKEQFVIAGSTTIASALLFAPSTGETIYVGPGTYGSSTITTLALNKSVKINGANIDVSYKSTRNAETHLLNHKFDILANNVEINGIRVTAPDLAGQTVFGGDNKTFNNFVVKNSIIEDINGMCLYYQGTGVRDGITFSQCKVSGIGNGTGTGTSSAFNPWLCKNVTINNCLIENVDYNGINLESVENATVTNNIIRNIGKSGIQLANACIGTFEIKNNEFTQINCRYYGWNKINTRNNIVNPVAPRTVSGTSDPDWQYYYAAVKWFIPVTNTQIVGNTIENNLFDNCWCGYQIARELPSTGGPSISFKNNTLQNNTHGDFMIYRPNTTNVLYNLKNNGIENASIKVFDWDKDGNGADTIEQWSSVLQRGTTHTIVLAKLSPALVQVETGKLITLQNMSINNVLDKAVNGDVIAVAAGIYTGNVIVNKSVTLLGQDKATTIIQPSNTTAATVQITDGASGTIIKNFTVKGKFATQTTTGAGDPGNDNSAILVLNTDTSTNPPIDNLLLENLVLRQASNGVAFNNKYSTNITIKDCVIQNNEGSGIRVASNTETMNGFLVDGCTIQNNNLNAIVSNPSGTYRPNCTNFKISNCTITYNNLLTTNNSHDVSILGFNGNIEISNTNIECKHAESKTVNGSPPTSGGWGLIIFGTGSSTATYKPSGNITMSNVTMTGNVIKSVLGIDRYSTLGTISMNNVNIKDCEGNKARQTWLQFAIGHRDPIKSFLLGNTKLKTMYTTNIGNVDATNSEFYDINTGRLLTVTVPDDLLQIKNQIYDKTLNSSIGEVIIAEGSTIISPTVANSIINSLNSESSGSESSGSESITISLVSGTYKVDTDVVNNSPDLKIIVAIGGPGSQTIIRGISYTSN